MMAANMYRVGDYVFFETSATAPYQIRRIEELNKTPTGNVEAKVMCFFRRRDISPTLVHLADRHQNQNMMMDEDSDDDSDKGSNSGSGDKDKQTDKDAKPKTNGVDEENAASATNGDAASREGDESHPLNDNQRHQLKHRELFLSRQVETLPATHIRGKCTVTLLNETEALLSYLNKDDSFFYTFVYDPSQKTLLADRGDIRVGSQFQAEIQPLLKEGESDGRDGQKLDELIWSPDSGLSESQVEQFVLLARSVGTLARALDCSSAVRQPSVVMSAAAASRDVTLFHALRLLHDGNYELAKAMGTLAPSSGPLLCRDEMEEWSASEGNLFEEAMDKYGKDFHDLRNDFLPWNTLKAIVEYYYMWKTTDRYVQQKRIKAADAERKLKQVYIPNYNKPNPAVLYNKPDVNGRGCESCSGTNSNQWYAWGPPHMQCRLCATCWTYWKKYGGLKMPTRLEKVVALGNGQTCSTGSLSGGVRSQRCTVQGCDKEFRLRVQLLRHLQGTHGVHVSEAELTAAGISANAPGKNAKNNKAMLMQATPETRAARRLCEQLLGGTRHCALNPTKPIDSRAASKDFPELVTACAVDPGRLITASRMSPRELRPTLKKLGIDVDADKPPLLERRLEDTEEQNKLPLSYPADPVALKKFFAALDATSAALAAAAAAESEAKTEVNGVMETAPPVKMSSSQPPIMKKRGYEHTNGVDEPQSKRPHTSVIRPAYKPSIGGTALPSTNSAQAAVPGGRVAGMSNHVGSKASGTAVKHVQGTNSNGGQGGTPDDSYLRVSAQVRKVRRYITTLYLRRAARRPGRPLQLAPNAGAVAVAAVAALTAKTESTIFSSAKSSNAGANNSTGNGNVNNANMVVTNNSASGVPTNSNNTAILVE